MCECKGERKGGERDGVTWTFCNRGAPHSGKKRGMMASGGGKGEGSCRVVISNKTGVRGFNGRAQRPGFPLKTGVVKRWISCSCGRILGLGGMLPVSL